MAQPFKDAIGQAMAFNAEGSVKVISSVLEPLSKKSIQEINKLVDLQIEASKSIFEDAELKGADLDTYCTFLWSSRLLSVGYLH
jgi:methyl-accepting chemotaxis protein